MQFDTGSFKNSAFEDAWKSNKEIARFLWKLFVVCRLDMIIVDKSPQLLTIINALSLLGKHSG